MKLSIIIGNYNTPKLVIDCIKSIYKYKPIFSFEVIVVDDASTDNSYAQLKPLEKEYRKLKVLRNIKNSGFVRTNNKGLHKSKGLYKLLLNSDTVVHENAIESLVNFAEKTPDAGVVGSRLLNKDGTIQESCMEFPKIKNVILKYYFGKSNLFEKFYPTGNDPVVVDSIVGASFLITPKAYKFVGKLNEKYTSYFEDLDYCREVYRNGLKVYYLPISEVVHYHGESFRQLSTWDNQWRKLVPGSIAYHGKFKHYLIHVISWVGQKFSKFFLKK